MLMRIGRYFSLLMVILYTTNSLAEKPGTCINSDEAELLQLVDDYRVANDLSTVPWSQSIMTVAQWHAVDAALNAQQIFVGNCNLHSWSETRPDIWSGGCYTASHANAAMMWNKPKEITGGIYTAYGFENAASGYWSVTAALNGWKGSPGHNEVILNKGIWASYPWRAMGVGVDLDKRYYYLWFSTAIDPQGDMPLCSDERSIFTSGFE